MVLANSHGETYMIKKCFSFLSLSKIVKNIM